MSAQARVKDFVKRFKCKGPVFEISALTREGCEPLVKAIYRHVQVEQRRASDRRSRPALCRRCTRLNPALIVAGSMRAMNAQLIRLAEKCLPRIARCPPHRGQGGLQPGDQRGPRPGRSRHRRVVPAARGAWRGDGREVIMVSSGAIAEGMKRLGWRRGRTRSTNCRPRPRSGRWAWRRCTKPSCARTAWARAQVLLTHADLADRERYLNARSTLLTLLRLGVVPVINENDTVVNDEIKFGDNDTLGALVANLVEADALVILTDQKGLYTADPRKDPAASFVHEAKAGDPALEAMAGGAGSSIGKRRHDHQDPGGQARGGFGRLDRDRLGPRAGLPAAAGARRGHRHLAGGADAKNQARKRWMADHLQLRGAVTVDDGRGGQGAGAKARACCRSA